VTRRFVVAPHPDDEVLGASHVLRGGDVTVVHVTDGVPPWLDEDEGLRLRRRRQAECDAAWRALGANVDDVVSFGLADLRAWREVDEIAERLTDLVGRAPGSTMYVPAHQGGHPDHDAIFAAAILARRRGSGGKRWRTYSLYGYDPGNRLVFGELDDQHYPGSSSVELSEVERSAKHAALACFGSQLRPDSVVQRWLDSPATVESVAPLPFELPSSVVAAFYDEELDFDRHGVTAARVDVALRAALR
jgi:LmbE family N-acetylglucosaminyl deacetylase